MVSKKRKTKKKDAIKKTGIPRKKLENLNEQLWKIAEDTAAAFGFSFAPDCEGHVRYFISNGISNMKKQKFVYDQDKISLVKTNTALFVTCMVAEAKRRQLPALHEITFHTIKDRLCPIWPFC